MSIAALRVPTTEELLVSPDLWRYEDWRRDFPHRLRLHAELELHGRLFDWTWRRAVFGVSHARHQLRGDLITIGGGMRLLELAAELLRHIDAGHGPHAAVASDGIPMHGRLRCWSLYEATQSELLVAPVLHRLGTLIWQPQGGRHGADYQVNNGADVVLVAEAKRLCRSRRYEQFEHKRILEAFGRTGPLFTPEEERAQLRADKPRLYRRVRHAAKQLRVSAEQASGAARAPARSVLGIPGVLFLDVEGNHAVMNLIPAIRDWMRASWAEPIDLIMLFQFACRGGSWGTNVLPIYARTYRALDAFLRVYRVCSGEHFHVGNPTNGTCEFRFGL